MSPGARRLVWIAQPAAIVLVTWLALGGPSRDVRAPLAFSGSGVVTLAQARLILEDSSWWSVPELRTPAVDDALLRPQNARIDQVLLRIARLFSGRISAVVTMAWALMLMGGGAVAAWCLRRLGVSMTGAWSAGVLFALTPFALRHNTAAFGLMPYLVPFAATAALALATRRDDGRGWRGLLVGNVALGLNGVYLSVFGAFFVGIGTVAGFVRGRRRADLTAGAAMLGAIVLATAVNVAPNFLAPPRHDGSATVRPSPAEPELRGLKIRRLVSPPLDHWFGPLRRWAEHDAAAQFRGGGETPGARLGLIAAVGFLGLIAILFFPSVAGPGQDGETIRAASRLTLAAILLATAGGLSSVFNLLVSPVIKDYTFITPFLVFYALAAVALGVDRVTRADQRLRGAVWAGLLVIGIADQSVGLTPLNATRAAISDEFNALRGFVGELEAIMPRETVMFQLPVRAWPGDVRLATMRPYDHFKPFVVSRTLRWSDPAVSAEQRRWQMEAAAVDPRDLPALLKQQGFSAIVVDRFGYDDDGTAVLAALQTVPSAARPVALNTRYVALDIREP